MKQLFTVIPRDECNRDHAVILEKLINTPEFIDRVYDKLVKVLQQEAREVIYGIRSDREGL